MKHIYRLFSIVFLLLCAIPTIGLLLSHSAEPASNQVLASAPKWTRRDGSWNSDFLNEAADYMADRFAFRQELITLSAQLTAGFFHESATDAVILGEDGWLYYADTLADYQGTAPLSERELWSVARTLSLIQAYAEECGAEFLFVVAPNKNTLYPGYMPSRYAKGNSPSNWTRLMTCLDKEHVSYLNLIPLLLHETEPVYFKTDSHWNAYGSALAHDGILEALGSEGTLAQEFFTTAQYQGDLYTMLYPAGKSMETAPALARERTFTHTSAFRSPEDMTIRTASHGPLGSLLMFRDSFGNSLYADLAETFSTACFSRAMPLRLDYLGEENADTVIFELVERNLSRLCTQAPVMEAPQREPVMATETVKDQITLSITEDTVFDDCVCYSGTVLKLDQDSPIYLCLDGVFYEATPAGNSENSFTLYDSKASAVAVLFRDNGRWVSDFVSGTD